MPYRLKPHESVRAGLARIVGDELKEAVSALKSAKSAYDADAVHRARQAGKKVRALLRLATVHLDQSHKKVDQQLGRMGRTLSDMRDADVVLNTFDALRARHRGAVPPAAFDGIRRQLARPPQRATDNRREGVRRAARQAARLARRSKRWRFGRGFGALSPGLEKGHQRAGNALAALQQSSTDERFHDLRKRVKTHWYHIRLLEPASAALEARRNALGRLDKTLGLDHDLTVLKGMIRAARAGMTAACHARVIALIEADQQRQRRAAIALARVLFRTAPRVFASRARHAWREWRD